MRRKNLLLMVGKAKTAVDNVRGEMSVANAALYPIKEFLEKCGEDADMREESDDYIENDADDAIVELGYLAEDLTDLDEDNILAIEEVLYTIEDLAKDLPE